MNLDLQSNPPLQKLINTFNSMPWEKPEFYKNWLVQSYYYTSHSTRMLAFAAGWTEYSQSSYYRRSLQHIREEQGHELLALRDAEKMGADKEQMRELGVTRALWEAQFYKLQRNPESLLGYILCLEQLAVATFKSLHTRLLEQHPEGSHDFVRVHAEEDPGHVDEAVVQICRCSSEAQNMIHENFEQTADMYRLMLESVLEMSQHQFKSVSEGHSKMYSTVSVEAQAMALPSEL